MFLYSTLSNHCKEQDYPPETSNTQAFKMNLAMNKINQHQNVILQDNEIKIVLRVVPRVIINAPKDLWLLNATPTRYELIAVTSFIRDRYLNDKVNNHPGRFNTDLKGWEHEVDVITDMKEDNGKGRSFKFAKAASFKNYGSWIYETVLMYGNALTVWDTDMGNDLRIMISAVMSVVLN